ncbi:MAG: enoyl-CoA hydratase/isomerase family protein [Caldilineaceae bacterium]|nr:enoyl-CoA hydratase/isomerase family protein [Caldilineaceae bacterium]
MPDYTDILTETHGRVGLVRLNRPKALNALRANLLAELLDALKAYDADDAIGAMVITGNEKAFSAGADIKEMADATAVDLMDWGLSDGWHRISTIRKPIIAAVSGFALGGGCELALLCDLIVASETAQFGQPEITIGVIPGAGGTQRLTRILGKALAMEMVLNNRFLKADEALAHGLVNRVVPVERYLDEALQLAGEIAARAPVAVRLGKEAINSAYELSLAEGLAAEERAFYLLFSTEDQKEGMRAFVEKCAPEWKGR